MIRRYYISLVDNEPDPTPIDADVTVYPQSGANNSLGLYGHLQRQWVSFYKNGLFHFGAAVAPAATGPTNPVVIIASSHDNKQEIVTTISEAFDDYHMQPSFGIDDGGDVYMFQEEIHNALIKIFKADNPNDISQGFTELTEKIGEDGVDGLAYPMLRKLSNDTFVALFRNNLGLGNNSFNYSIFRSNNGLEDWDTLQDIHVATRQTSASIDRLYPAKIRGADAAIGGYQYFPLSYRIDLNPGGNYFAYGAFKIPDADLVAGSGSYRVYNLDGDLITTLDGTNPMSDAERDQLIWLRYGPNEINLNLQRACMSPNGRYYCIVSPQGVPDPPELLRRVYIHNGTTGYLADTHIPILQKYGFFVGVLSEIFWYNSYIFFWSTRVVNDESIFYLWRTDEAFTDIDLLSSVTLDDYEEFRRVTSVDNITDVPVGDNMLFTATTGSGGQIRDYALIEVDGSLFT